jgi:hypothetical protein
LQSVQLTCILIYIAGSPLNDFQLSLEGDTRHVNPPGRGPQRPQQPVIPAGPAPVRLYDNPTWTIIQSHEWSTALTNGHGIPDVIDGSQEPYNGITQIICIALADTIDMDLDKSPCVRAGVKLKHPEAYSRGSDLEEFEGFVANILRWLKMNYLLGLISMGLQVSYMGTCLTGESPEGFTQRTF